MSICRAPIALDLALLRGSFLRFVKYTLLAFASIAVGVVAVLSDDDRLRWAESCVYPPCCWEQGPLVAIDSFLYSRLVLAPLNIVLYNVLSSHEGSQMYGKEFLNDNTAQGLTVASGCRRQSGIRAALCGIALWRLVDQGNRFMDNNICSFFVRCRAVALLLYEWSPQFQYCLPSGTCEWGLCGTWALIDVHEPYL